jgi:hypothetical protein
VLEHSSPFVEGQHLSPVVSASRPMLSHLQYLSHGSFVYLLHGEAEELLFWGDDFRGTRRNDHKPHTHNKEEEVTVLVTP